MVAWMRAWRTATAIGLAAVTVCACSPSPAPPKVVQEPVTPPPAPAPEPPKPNSEPKQELSETKATPEPDPAVKAEAERRYKAGHEMFRQGRYDSAEIELKEALNLYPFMAEANLVLGKVFLIRGAAARDQVLINSARLMFKMANSIDPELREAGILLSLFKE